MWRSGRHGVLGKLLFPTIEELIKERDFRTLKQTLSTLPSVDLADIMADVDEAQISLIFRLLPKDKATEVFEYLDFDDQKMLLQSLSREKVKGILEEMSVDDRTQLLDEVPPEVASQLIELLPPQDRQLAQTILNYPEHSVGRLITPDYVSLHLDMTVREALDRIRTFGKDMETVYACYIIGEQRRLLGFTSLRKLVTSPLDAVVKDFYEDHFVFLRTDTPQEEAVEMFRRYDLIALPVLDSGGNMVGIVTFDDMMDVAMEEFREDMELMAAVVPGDSDESFLDEKLTSLVWRRVPWLIMLLTIQAVAALILVRFESLLEAFTALLFFLPALTATGGNTGTQSSSMVIRAIATGEISDADRWIVLRRAFMGGIMLATILGTVGFVISFVIKHDPMISLCVASGLAVVVTLSNLAGSLLPIGLKRFGWDPALMSGPFISTITDIFGLFVYLEISRFILRTFA
ncbi:magnesium transporter [bacterium]|nr:magnesium transporter [bacterium]